MSDLASRIDHTILKAEAAPDDVQRVVDEAIEHGFASVCVNGVFASRVVAALGGGPVEACAVAGFPLGASAATVKAIEATSLAKQGVHEIDFVAHLPAALAADAEAMTAEFIELVKAARAVNPRIVVKVILETALLLAGVSADQGESRIEAACTAARRSGCDFVKTSSGFHPAGGASVEAVRLLKKHGQGMCVKAAGGIRTLADARAMLDAGADRLGCSASVAIVREAADA